MIEKIVLDHLNNVLDVPAYMEKPESPPERYVLIEKTGSGTDNQIHSSTLAVQSYAATLYQAAELNESIKAAMNRLIELDEITRAKLNSDYNFTDTTKKQYRYQAVFDLTHY